jgi:methanogenic corrinoid protein MtbC1
MIEGAMKVVIDALKELGTRKDYIVLVGGAPLDEQSALAVGADIYCNDISVTVAAANILTAKGKKGPVAA